MVKKISLVQVEKGEQEEDFFDTVVVDSTEFISMLRRQHGNNPRGAKWNPLWERLKRLPLEVQFILFADLKTAFEERLKVYEKANRQ